MPHRKEIPITDKILYLIKEKVLNYPAAGSLGETLKHLYGFSIDVKNVNLEDLLI